MNGNGRIHVASILPVFSTRAFVVINVLQHKRKDSKYCHHKVQIPPNGFPSVQMCMTLGLPCPEPHTGLVL